MADRGVTAGAVVASVLTSVWRLGIAGLAFWTWWLYGHDPAELVFLTQSGNLLTALVFGLLALVVPVVRLATGREPDTSGILRGAMTVLLLIVGSVYLAAMGDISEPRDLIAHVVTPLLVLADWCFVGRAQNRARWWHPLLWVVLPAGWFIGYASTGGYAWVRGGSPLYSVIDPASSGFPGVLGALIAAGLGLAYLVYGIARAKRALSDRVRRIPLAASPTPEGREAEAGVRSR